MTNKLVLAWPVGVKQHEWQAGSQFGAGETAPVAGSQSVWCQTDRSLCCPGKGHLMEISSYDGPGYITGYKCDACGD